MKTGISYIGTWDSPAGYGSAARQDITALYNVGVDIKTELIYQMAERTDYGFQGQLCLNLKDRNIPYRIKLTHLTPDTALNYFEKDKYNILRLFWETDKLPEGWIEPCNKANEIWTSSSAMAELFRASGVKVPIYWFPQPIDIAEGDKPYGKFEIDGHKGFMFYTIAQWIERYNFKTLITAYWEAFAGRDDVSLLLKTYRVNYTEQEQDKIILDIQNWKKEFRIKNTPRILFTPNLLTHDQIMELHNTGDCYITATRGDGWNRPIQEALLLGKPVISTARGGIHEHLIINTNANSKNDDLYFPVPSEYVPVTPVSWIPYYSADQNWAEIDRKKLIEIMQWVFSNQELAKAKGMKAKDFIKDNFSFFRIGTQMKIRLEQIEKNL